MEPYDQSRGGKEGGCRPEDGSRAWVYYVVGVCLVGH